MTELFFNGDDASKNATSVIKKGSIAYQKLSPVPSGEERGIILSIRGVIYEACV
jgi:hypothetical protein